MSKMMHKIADKLTHSKHDSTHTGTTSSSTTGERDDTARLQPHSSDHITSASSAPTERGLERSETPVQNTNTNTSGNLGQSVGSTSTSGMGMQSSSVDRDQEMLGTENTQTRDFNRDTGITGMTTTISGDARSDALRRASSSSSSSSSSSDEDHDNDTKFAKSTTTNTSNTSTSEGLSGDMSRLGLEDKMGGSQVMKEAPVVKERVHEHYDQVDKTQVDELHDKTEVRTVVQPILDEQHQDKDTRRIDEGVEIHEHGQRGLDANAEAQLRARREEIARQGGTKHSEEHSHRDERPDVNVQDRTHVVEQVQPVIEKDIYVPHRVEHHKKEVEIYHEAPTIGGTVMAPAVTVSEFNREHHKTGPYQLKQRDHPDYDADADGMSGENTSREATYGTHKDQGPPTLNSADMAL